MTRRCTRCTKNRQVRFFAPRGRICTPCQKKSRSAAAHGRRVTELYGITEEEYQALFAAQDGKCAICHGRRPYRLHVDHDHAVDREHGSRASVRGLLCKRCNGLLARVRDNARLLADAAKYLAAWPSRGVL